MKMIKLAVAVAAVLGSTAALAQQAEGNWMMRVRAVDVQWSHSSSDAQPGLGLGLNDAVQVQDKIIPEVDFSYFFTKNIAAELILTYPQKFDVKVKSGLLAGTAAANAGSFKGLPPTLTFQYHFAPDATFRPYVGAGINYTAISDVSLGGLNGVTGVGSHLTKDSWGGALQAGFDYKIGQNSFINFDIKKVYISTDLKVDTLGTVSKLNVDPVLIGIGYGFKF